MVCADVKAYRTYEDQVDLLVSRGMAVGDREQAVDTLRRINYYRLSGYWYPFRHQVGDQRGDSFYPGTHLDDVVALHDFDARLRAATFSVLAPIELALRAHLGHELGRVDPCAHLDPMMLGPAARGGDGYATWLESYEREIARSREDFVAHPLRRPWTTHSTRPGLLKVWLTLRVWCFRPRVRASRWSQARSGWSCRGLVVGVGGGRSFRSRSPAPDAARPGWSSAGC